METTRTKWDESMIVRCFAILPNDGTAEVATSDYVKSLKIVKGNPKASNEDEWTDFRIAIDLSAI